MRWATIGLVLAGLLAPVVVALLTEVPMTLTLPRPYTHSYYDVKCFLLTAGLALAVLLVSHAFDRGRPRVATAIAAGLTGVAGITLHCPINYLLLGHASVPIALALVYLAVGRVRARAA